MKFKKPIFIFVIILILISIGSVAATGDINSSVDNTGDLTDSKQTISFEEFNTIVQNKESNGEINLTYDVVYNEDRDSKFVNGINIDKNLTINGNGFTIDAKNSARIFYVTSNINLILNNAKFINGNTTDNGGAIYGYNVNLIINNCTFSNNTGNGLYSEGGAFYVSSSELTIVNSLFSNNFATAGGAIYSYNSLAIINNSNFMFNVAEFYGGVIYSNNVLLIDKSNFINNSAGYRGGVIHETIGSISSGYVNLKNSIFSYNRAKNGGVLSSSSIANNNFIYNCTMYNNSAYYGSIVSLTSKSEISIFKSLLFNNSAIEGGLIYSLTNGFIRLEDNDIYTNFANRGTVFFSLYDDILINNCKLENNKVNNSLFYLGKGNIGIYNSSITTNNTEYDCNVIYKIENGTIYLSNNWWGSLNPNYDKLINASKAIIIFDESYKREEPLIFEFSEGECGSSILQLNGTEAIINHRRDGGTHLPLFITEDDIVCQRKTIIGYFFNSFTTSDGWMVGHGGWDDPNLNEKIEAISLKMIKNNVISQDYCDMVFRLMKSIGCGHYIIKSPNGTFYAACYKNEVGINQSGILKLGDYIVCPNGPEYFRMGHYDNIISPVAQSIYLLATDYYGTSRHNIMTYYYHDGVDEIYASNDDGSLTNFNDGGADDIWTSDKFVSGNDIPVILDKLYIDTHIFSIETNSSWKDLKDKLNNPDEYNNVFLNGETYKALVVDTGIVINKNISIYGGFTKDDLTNGIIDGNDILNCNIIIAPNCSVEFHNIIFKNFNCDRLNDVFINNGNLILDSVLFNIDKTEGNILVNNGKLLINNSKFSNNWCSKHLILSENTLIIENSYFDNNGFDSNEYDGIIFIEAGVCNVTNTTFNKNTIDSGGVFAINNAYLNIDHCLFTSNTCFNFGGTIYNKKGYVTINSSNFTTCYGGLGGVINNNGISCKIYSSNFKDNRASLNGGTIYNSGLICEIYDSNFINSKSGNSGGAIYNSRNTVNLTNCTFLNCVSKYGGAIYNLDKLNCYKCKFINNKATSKGGALFIINNTKITNSIFDNNVANIANAIYVKDSCLSLDYNYWASNNPDFNSLIYGAIPKNYVLLDLDYNNTIANLTFKSSDGSVLSNIPDYNVSTYLNLKFLTNTTISNNKATLKILEEPNILSINSAYSQIPLVNLTFSNVQLNANNLTKYFGSEDEFKLVLTNDGYPLVNETVSIKINGITYNITTDNNGIVTLPICLNSGNYTVYSIYRGSFGIATSVNNIEVKPTIVGKDIVVYCRNGSSYRVHVVDSQGKTVINQIVKMNINGVVYDCLTDSKGNAFLLIGLNAGNYIITCENTVNGEKTSNNITVLPTLIGEDISLYFCDGSKYSVKVVDGVGRVVANQVVRMNINGVSYDCLSNANGYAYLPICLNAGNYIVTAENLANDEKISNTITVLPTLIGEDVSLYHMNGSGYSVKVLNKDGSPAINANVRMNINGVVYDVTSDDRGIAFLPICLAVGEYIITTEYEGFMTSNKIKVLPVLIGNDIIVFYGDNAKYTIKVLDGTGNPLSNVAVTMNINGVLYNKITNDYGIAELPITFPVGQYIVTTTYGVHATSNTISVIYRL